MEDVKMDTPHLDPKALYQLGYGLYVVTTRNGEKDNGCIVNTVMQVSSQPLLIAVGVHKQSYTCEMIRKSGRLNVNSLSEDTPFEVFELFGYQSGREVDKFEGRPSDRSENGCIVLSHHLKGFLSLVVEREIELGSHILFLCKVDEGRLLSNARAVTYAYYQDHIKPKPQPQRLKGFVCNICGYVYEGESLPEDFICPICKHGTEDFEPL